MIKHRQRILAAASRSDGHDVEGNPGDCLRACVASMLSKPYDSVPNFSKYLSWFETMRWWAREIGRDFDAYCPDGPAMNPGQFGIATGPSPRGDFLHCVVVDHELETVHDPHPSDAGILGVRYVILLVPMYQPAPYQLMLSGAGQQ